MVKFNTSIFSVLVFSILLSEGNGLLFGIKCFQCQTKVHHTSCEFPENDLAVDFVPIEKYASCYTFTAKYPNDSNILIIRGAMGLQNKKRADEICSILTEKSKLEDIEEYEGFTAMKQLLNGNAILQNCSFCYEDYCNMSTSTRPNLSTFYILTAGIFLRYLYRTYYI